MSNTIAKAMDMARELASDTPGPASGELHAQRICPGARSVTLSRAVMESHRLLGGISDQRVIDSYSLLRSRVLYRVHQRSMKTLGVTSPSPGDGKSLTAANLAISIALGESHPVLLVDADLRRPSVADLFGVDVDAGLGDYLKGHVSLEDLLLRTPVTGLYLLPGRPGSKLRPEAMSVEKVRQLAITLKRQVPGGLVVFDLPPVLVGGDAASFAPVLDGVLMVVADQRTGEPAMARSVPLLEGAFIVGTVLNFVDRADENEAYYPVT